MNAIIIISVLSLLALVECSEPIFEIKPCSGLCRRYGVDTNSNAVFTQLVEEEVKLYKSLICSPDSYFKSITYSDSYNSNQTCFGLLYSQSTNVKSLYTGQPRRGGRPIVLNAEKQIKTVNFINGNYHRIEESFLYESGECGGDLLVAVGDYIASDPLKGCCSHHIGVKGLTAVAYDLVIYGKCCSRCYLQEANFVYSKAINNNGQL